MSTSATSLEHEILDHLIEHFEVPADSTTETGFEGLGFDSLATVELSLTLEKMYAVELDDIALKEAGSAAGIAALLRSKGVTGVVAA
ncbi:acyl carrier protein [Streptomyces sp. NBC_01716]|uniref:acyl carrier protein n=1 Tax=Streptomyces sp. NBC_01716 TaxID=2975917 RepID=UPI002E31A390|nr:acyl carrier protein [Streptomyces sp. NBC_01716]